MSLLAGIGIQVQLLHAAADDHAAAEQLGTMERIFKKNTPPTGITVRTKEGTEKDIVEMLLRGMAPDQVSDLLGKPEKVFVPSGSSGPSSFPSEWSDADEEWWIYPNRKTKDGRYLQLLFANRSGGKKILFSVWLWPSETDSQQRSAGQPATAPQTKSEGKEKPQPQSKPAPR
ncbi:hypothetical protein [Luteolibacter soli]|uniref:Outer membrane protein assembly factor BamE n=1 Tax=Luteolibacter soli TaxID=3135280 RepID=A0ABU9ARI5_9BACT